MRKIALLLVLLFCVSSEAWAADFMQVSESSNYTVYVDAESVQARDGYVVAWVKWIPRGDGTRQLKDLFKKEVAHYLSLTAYHMEYKQYQDLSTTYYDKTGSSIETFTNPFATHNYEEAIPDSVGEGIYDFVMEIYRDKTRPVPTAPQ